MSLKKKVQVKRRDWVSSPSAYLVAWGIPSAVLVVGLFLPPTARTSAWSTALIWMGIACILNALRCSRLHCYLTGPFFLLMAGATILHGFDIISLGPDGWIWLGLTLVVVGAGLLWYLPERIWGKYTR